MRFFTALVCLAPFLARAHPVVINELMYDTVTHSTNEEWLELYNTGTNTVNLLGWRFTKGIDFTFSNAVNLAPGAYLVVVAKVATFTAAHPGVTNFVGGWTGTLANNGEAVRLEDADGNKVDEVTYATEGDWGQRVRVQSVSHFGWLWTASHGGTGKSLERINPNLHEDSGQDWAASTVDDGTPGAANSVLNLNSRALILETAHLPLLPRSTNSIIITSRIVSPQGSNVTVTLFYRVDVNPQVNPFIAVTMLDNGSSGDGIAGDGVFGAILSARPNGTIIEYYVEAVTQTGVTNYWPALADTGGGALAHAANALLQVDDSTYTGDQPIYRLVMTEAERATLAQIVSSDAQSDAAMNGTIVSLEGASSDLRYLLGIRIRGAGSRGVSPPNYRVNVPNDRPWKGIIAFNLNTQFTHSQLAGYALASRSGLITEAARVVQVRVNAANLASAGSPQFGSYIQLEVPDSAFADNHFPLNANGNIYRASSGSHSASLSYLGTTVSSYINAGYSKENNSSENDWSDFINFVSVLNNTPDATYASQVRQVVNVDEWMLYFAVFTLTLSGETSLGTGFGDDFGMYRGGIDTRFDLLAHDWDTILGQGSGANFSTGTGLFRATAVASMNRFLKNPEFVPTYYATLKRLLDTTFSNEQESRILDDVLASWVPAASITAMKISATNRNAFVRSQIPLQLTAASPLPVISGFPQTASPSTSLNGFSDAINTRTILVNGSTSIWSAWEARWTNNNVNLQPGINRILVQALGTNGTEILRTNIDVWYDVAATAVSGTIASDTTWTAAAGPYNVTGNITVPAGVTLTIEAGTTIFLNSGVTFTVNGRLLAPGTDTAHIRFTRVPGGGTWGSLDFLNTTTESRLEFVDIDSCAGTTIGSHAAEIHVNGGSRVFFDHLVFANTPAQEYISFDGSSFIVQNSIFPTYPWATSGPEMLHGVNGIPAGGYGIFRDNYFGHTYGFNDTIDFTGGQRPGAILQIINNIFDGAGDDHLDFDSTDAWIEGNIFMHAHRDPNRTDNALDTASAISGGIDFAGQFSEWTIINNLFYDLDHAFLNKGGGSPGAGRVIFANNTLVHVAKESGGGLPSDIAAFDFTDDSVPLPDPSYGAGAYVVGNILWDVPALTANYNSNNHTVIFENNILPTPWTGPGSNNVVTDPRLNLQLITTVTNADWKTVKAALTPRSGSAALGTGYGAKYDKGGLNPRGLLIYGEPPAQTTNTSATLTVAPGGTFNWGSVVPPYLWGYTHYKWKLDNGAWSAETAITTSPTITLNNLALGGHTVYVVGKNDAGYYQDDTFVYPTNSGLAAHLTASRTWTVVAGTPGSVILNEILAHNSSAFVHEDETPDVVELFNPGTTAVNLSGKGITDDPTQNHYKFIFPTNTTLGAGQYLLVYADSSKTTSGFHLGFALNDNGDSLYLYDAVASGGALLDSITFGLQLNDISIGRLSGGSWGLTYPTLGAANAAYPLGEVSLLKINEWLTDETFGNDFVEIYNRDTLPVNIGGSFLTDTPETAPTLHQFPALSFLPASGYFPFVADGDTQQGAEHISFKLSPERGAIALFAPDLSLIDCIIYGPQTTDISEGRTPNGSDTRAFFVVPTPGAANPGSGGVIITITNVSLSLFGVSDKQWRYDNSGTDYGSTWLQAGFDDSSWDTGSGLFGFETTPNVYSPYVFNTTIPAPNQANGHITVYYRTTFVWTNGTGWQFFATNLLDDGAVFYLNGVEAGRLRITANPVLYSTLAANQTSEGLVEVIPLSTAGLIDGTNSLQVEVHQSTATSTDDVFGMGLGATRSTTNATSFAVVLNEVMANNKSFTNADGTVTDWVEIYNPSLTTFDLSNTSLSDDFATPRRWVFPAGVTVPSGGYLVVKFDSASPASTNAGPNMNAGFGFSSGGDKVLLFDTPAHGGALLDSIQFGLQAADFTIGRLPNGSGPWALTLPTEGGANLAAALGSVAGLRVNEWMADPKSGDDYFELYNPDNKPVSLGGLYLTDDLNNRTQYRIPNLSFIGLNERGFIEFHADNNPQNGADHVNFRLAAGGELVALYASDGLSQIDYISFGQQQKGVSEGRFPDGGTNIVRFPDSPTPGQANFLPFNNVVINEALTHSDVPFEDAIELFNTTAEPINIGGWYLSDSQLEPRKFRIPNNTILPPGGFAVFYEYQFNPTFVFPSFSLSSANGDQVFLSVTDTNGTLTGYRASVDFGAQENGVTFGRFETSVGFDFVSMSARSLGADNPASLTEFRTGHGATNPYAKVGPVVVNEIHYHPPNIGTNDNTQDEFIELRNLSASTVPLFDTNNPTQTWHLRSGVDFDFASNTWISANGYLLVVGFDPATNAAALAAFRAVYSLGTNVAIVGPWNGKLNNDEDDIHLNKPDISIGNAPYVLVERIHYHDSTPWPSAADGNTNGTGLSLQRVVGANYANDPVNWIAGVPTPGSASGAPAGTPPSITLQPTNRTVVAGTSVAFVSSASGSAALKYQWRFRGLDIPDATNTSYTVASAQSTNAGGYSVRVANAFGSALSATAVLTLQAAPQIVFQPQSIGVPPGGNATLSVGVRGTPPLNFQWWRDGAPFNGATQFLLSVTNVQATNTSYFVVVTNVFGATTSAVAIIQLQAPPLITAQPTNLVVIIGQTATFTVGASGSAPLSYQWRFNGGDLAGQTGPTLTFLNTQPSRAGTYSVVVNNPVGSVTSSNATLIVIVPPTVSITATDPNAAEQGQDPGLFTITRNGSNNIALAIHFSVGGSAQNGTDYQSIPAQVTIPAGTNSATVAVLPFDDAVIEANETVVLALTPAPEYIIGSPSNATVTIVDNDNLAPSVAVTTPASGAFFPVTPTNIFVAATASDPNGGQAVSVSFYYGPVNIGVVGAAPYQLTWTNPPSGSNVLVAVATDSLGLSTTSAAVALVINGPPVVGITNPTNGASVAGPGNVVVVASATDTNGTVAQVDLYVGPSGGALALIGSVTSAPYSATLTNAAIGSYQAVAVARDSFGLSATSAVVNFSVALASTNFADMFANRGVVTGFTNYKTGSNVGATKEVGEPNHYTFNAGGRSVWIDWVAPGTGIVTIDLAGSTFDTTIGVYTNTPGVSPTVTNLIKVAEGDDFNGSLQSRIQFTNTVVGTVFHIAVDGYSAASGNIQMRLGLPPPPPSITAQPTDQFALVGSNATFTVGASGVSLVYQWRFNGLNLGGATGSSYTRVGVQLVHVGNYSVVVSSTGVGSVTSSVARLFILTPPSLVSPRRTNNSFTATLTGGNTNRSYFIEVSTNLVNWTVITTLSNGAGVPFTDTNATFLPPRLYRARLAP